MTTHSLVRCEHCRAVISSAEAMDMIRHGVPCGACGATLSRSPPRAVDHHVRRPSPERRLLGVLRAAEGRPVGLEAINDAGIDDPANAIYQLECSGHRIEREYTVLETGRRRLLGYRLRVVRSIR